MAEPLLLGVDEGTTGVKAALFTRELKQVGEARRDKVNRHPQAGWVEQDGDEVLAAVVDAVAELLADPPGEVVACGLDHQGESVLAWDAESGEPLTPIVVWQDKRSQEVLDRLAEPRGRGPCGERPSVRSLLLGRQARLAARARRGGGARSGARHAADGHRRLVPLRPPRRRLRHRPLDGVADPAPANRRPGQLRSRPVRDLRGPDRRAAGDPRYGGRPRRPRAPELAGRGAAAWADRRSAGGARGRGGCGPRPGQGDLRDRGLRPRPRGRAGPRAGRRPAADGRVDASTDGPSTRSTAACSRPGRCSSGSVASSASPPTRRRSASSPATRTTPAGSASCPGWRASGRRGGGRTPAPSSPGSAAGRPPRRSRARRSRGSPGASRTSSRRSGSRSRSTACGSTAGSRTSR